MLYEKNGENEKAEQESLGITIPIQYQYTLNIFPGFLSPNIFNPPKHNPRLM